MEEFQALTLALLLETILINVLVPQHHAHRMLAKTLFANLKDKQQDGLSCHQIVMLLALQTVQVVENCV
jgi:hypothetical protein